MKIAVRVLLGLVGLVVVAVAGLVVVLMTLDPNEYRDQLTAEVKKATGRELAIKGDLSVGISLVPTIVANDVSFANAAWGSRPEMARLKRLETNLEILPLLSGDIRIGRIVLVEPDILLEVAPDGRANWDFGSGGSSSDPPTIPHVGSISIDKGVVRFRDRQSKQDLTVTVDRARIDETAGDRRLQLDIAGAYNGVPIQVAGTIDPLARLAANASDYAVDLEAAAFAIDARVKGQVGTVLTAPRLGLDLTVAGKDLNATLAALKAVVPGFETPAIPPVGGFDVAAKVGGAATAPAIESFRFTVGTTDALKIEGSGRGQGNTYTLDRLAARIKGSDIGGTATARIGGKVPEVKADLASKHFNTADVLALLPKDAGEQSAQPAAPKGKPAPAGDGRVFPADPLPLDALKTVNAEVTLQAQRLVAEGMAVDGIEAKAVLKDGKLTLDPFGATVAEGRIAGRTVLDASAKTPALDTALTFDKVNLGQLLKERGVTEQLAGHVNGKANLRGTGDSVRALMAGLTGNTEVTMRDGRIANEYVELIAADLAKRLLPGSSGGATRINCFVSRFDIKQGIATSTGLLFDTERMTIAGGGTVDLRQERLNLTINPEPKDTSLVSLAVPLQISGTFTSPSVAPTTASVIKGVAGLAIMGLTPLGALASVAKLGTGDQNPCVAALDQKPSAPAGQGGQPQAQPSQPSNPVDSATKGVQDTLRSIFGGK